MRARLFVLATALGILALQWAREPGLSRSTTPLEPADSRSTAPVPAPAEPRPWPGGGRDPFRFAGPEPQGDEPLRAMDAPGQVPAPPPSSPPVRLVGLIRRSGDLQAVLAADGEVALVAVGGHIGPFEVVSLDEEGWVRLRGGDGVELTLTLPEEP